MSSLVCLGELAPQVAPDSFVADNARLIGDVRLAGQASVWFNVTIRGDLEPITVGERTNVQDGAVLHTDPGEPLTIGADVTVGHMAMLHGCTIGDGSLIGIGAIVLSGARIGRGCLIGAGALIPEGKVIPDRSVVLGAPGKVVRTLGDEEADGLREAARHYVENAARYRSHGN
jgi:carbonic anhydrase/acetyltransferase-like protein (isoleucine patch superfamily)